MANRFAVASGNWNNASIWDNGSVPLSTDDVYANTFTVTINGTFTAQSVRNTLSTVLVPNIATPIMTSNTTPSGVAFASSTNVTNFAWNAFSQDGTTTVWQGGVNSTGILGYQFTSGKIIKRYCVKGIQAGVANSGNPFTWTFQGSNDGITYTTLETVTSFSMPAGSNYTSGILPNTTSYTYYRINIVATQAVALPIVSEFEMTESIGTVLGTTAGGQFIYANGGDLTCTGAIPFYSGVAATAVIEMTLVSGNTGTFNGSALVNTSVLITTGTAVGLRLSNTGTLNINGSFTTTQGAGSGDNNKNIINVTGNGTLNLVGDLIHNSANGTGNSTIICTASSAIINITGNITSNGSSGLVGGSAISMVAGTLNVTGNVLSSTSASVYTSGGNVNLIGNVTGGTTQPAIINGVSTAIITATGIITSGSGAPAIYSVIALTSAYSSGTYVKISGNVINTLNNMAVVAPRVTIDSATSSWLFQISTGGNRTLYAAGVALGNPATNNVRLGTVYGASSELTGTLIVPSPSNVLQGVGTDATTGTLLMTPADFWNYLISSGFTANSIGDRLQNASTVATTGGQIASYNV